MSHIVAAPTFLIVAVVAAAGYLLASTWQLVRFTTPLWVGPARYPNTTLRRKDSDGTAHRTAHQHPRLLLRPG